MEENYEQRTSAIGSLRSILQSYPFSVGIFREILQNSDDAGASKQIFVLDRRNHPVVSLNHANLASTQGPALLAYNDALFKEADWESLKHAFESSKSDDSSKIGKYGIGFRSVYHITDCPQILSGSFLTISDPLKSFTDTYGKRINLLQSFSTHTDQLSSFDWFINHGWKDTEFEGTIIRCPLRSVMSKISAKIVHADEISQLFHDFMTEEIDISLLFLQNITSIEIYEVNEKGKSTCVAASAISRSASSACGDGSKTYKSFITKNSQGKEHEQVWRLLHCPFLQEEAVAHLAKRRINDPGSTLREHKLVPNVSLAVPLSITTQAETGGRLFTFLPLPLKTGFPVHVHALFALTQSRQHLRNSGETGIVSQAADHVVIEWNKLLFDEFIPRAWRLLLEVLVQKDGIIDVFRAWPNKQPTTLSGDTVYWQSLPTRVLQFVISSGSPVWPVYSLHKNSPMEYKILDALMTSQPAIREAVLRSLTTMGLELTRPPAYLVDEVKNLVDRRYVILTPEAAHDALLKQDPARLMDIPREDTSVVLEYLLSTDNVLNIVGLPFIKTASGRVAVLTALNSQPAKTYTMLDRGEFSVFGSCDDNSIIGLKDLPSHVTRSLQSRGPKFINVENLGPERIVEYLTSYPSQLGFERVRCQWLSIFWVWMSTYSHRTDLYPKIKHLFLLPTTHGLKTAETPLFKSRGEHPLNIRHLSSLGVVFLDAGLSEAAQAVIASYGLLKIINQDIHTLLDSLPSDHSNLSLDKDAPPFILAFISARASAACASHGPFNEEQIERLKKLPIYPVFVSSGTTSPIYNWTSIPDGYSIRTISRPSFLPVIEKIAFVEAQSLTSSLLGYLQPDNSSPLSDVQFLALTFDHFTEQSASLQAVVLQHVVHHQRQLPPSLLSSLVQIAFVVSIDGSKRKPGEVVDPKSPISCLFEGDSARQVRTDNGSERAIVGSLHSMSLMQHKLTIPMIEERIGFISANHSSPTSIDLSRSLLAVIQSTHFDCSGLSLVPGQKWLPTDRGLCVPEECRDGERNRRDLFDEVLGVLEQGIQIPHSLRSAFKWDRPIETATIIKQFSQVLDKTQVDDTYEKVVAIIKELSERDCSDSDLVTLRSITTERKWVPTSSGQLARTVDAVFSLPIAEAGFEQIPYISTRVRKFLFDLGCSEAPSQNAILVKLNALSTTSPTLDALSVKVAVNLLNILPSTMSDEEHAALLIPDKQCNLHPHSEIYFNDIAERASLVPTENHFIAHDLVDDALARKLNLARLGLRFVDLNIPGVDMGEKPLTTVRNTLRQYTEQQFVTEFVANACDANATKLTFLVNEFCSNPSENTRLLSPTMQKFFNCPSLVVYNNAKFSDQDFTGICRTSIGGKESKSDTIGQFGLGALTMFHITELAIIISNADVLFLNPSKEHLPTSDRAALKIKLNHIRRFYPDHLSSINGLFGFDASSSDPYEGTIFILPLRIPSHCESEWASDTMWSASDIQQKILEPFEKVASNCLLFTKIEELCSVSRNADGTETVSWSTRAELIQEPVEEKSGFSTSMATLSHISTSGTWTSYWKTASATVAEAQIPPKLLSALAKQYRLRLPPIIGLAASLDDPLLKTEFNFFSTLPLAIKTTLPVHIMASFVLSPDRRQIRLDEFNNPETEYNRWLLSSIIPPLYLFLLESFSSGDNARWWPGRLPHTLEPIAQILVNAFFSVHLKRTERHVFRSMYNNSSCMTKDDCVLFDGERCVKKVLSLLRSHKLVKLPKFITRRAADESGIAIVDPVFLRNEILRDPSVITSVPKPNFAELEELFDYLAGKGVADKATGEDSAQADVANLIDLPLLPLADGTFGTFQGKECPTSYFVWTSRRTSARSVFPLDRLVHPQLKPKSVLKPGLNVSSLNSDVVKAFIEDRLPQSPIIEDADQETIEWIKDFWNDYPFLDTAPLQPTDIFEFPLVPTIRPRCFVSLEACSSGPTCIFRGNSQEQLWDCLDRLGLTVVQVDNQSNSESLTYIFNSRMDDFPESRLERILSAMNVESPTVSERFSNLEADSQRIFASWARPQICRFVEDLSRIAQELPIWEVVRPGEELELHAASEVLMLPEGLSTEIAARFTDGFVAEWGNLKYLNGPKLTFAELEEHLDLPAVLGPSDLLPYKELLTIWIAHLPFGYLRPLPVPNSYGDIISSDMLYAREELFEAAFGVDSVDIPAIEFHDLEDALYRYGLRGTSGLDMTMFTACAEATHYIVEDEDRARRAEIVFRAYCFDLPLRVGQDAQCSWSSLDNLRFIPRNMVSVRRLEHREDRRMELDIPQRLQDLPDVVSPNELVRKEFESIAWTQRASFSVQPDYRILMANPGLGLPHITEVISHLSALSSFPVQSQLQRQIIIHDMVETLKWLNENVVDSENILYEHRYEDIFLNVDDPSAEAWIWTNANELAFEAEDIQADNGIRCVRKFLLPYDRLLRAAGVVQVIHPQCPMSDIGESDSVTLQSIRVGFNDLRRKGLWTDVVFVTSRACDDDDTGIAPSLVAHRSFLTAFSDYFSDMFCGEFREANDASSSNPIRFPVDYSADCIQLLLDYIYTGDEPSEDCSLDLLLEAVELSGYWRLEHFFEEVQRTIVKRRLISPLTLDCIQETAERAKAEVLLRQSQEYEEKNAVYIQKVRSLV